MSHILVRVRVRNRRPLNIDNNGTCKNLSSALEFGSPFVSVFWVLLLAFVEYVKNMIDPYVLLHIRVALKYKL